MKRIARYTLLCLSILVLHAEEPVTTPLPRQVLSNQGIVTLAEAGYDEDFLIDLIQCKQTRFDTTVEGLAFLAKHAISERIVRFMIASENKTAGPSMTAPAPSQTAPPVVAPAPTARLSVLAVPTIIAGAHVKVSGPPAVAGPYVMVERHLFRTRWYVVNPNSAPAPAEKSWGLPVNTKSGTFPAW